MKATHFSDCLWCWPFPNNFHLFLICFIARSTQNLMQEYKLTNMVHLALAVKQSAIEVHHKELTNKMLEHLIRQPHESTQAGCKPKWHY